jgi:hypothetical protein
MDNGRRPDCDRRALTVRPVVTPGTADYEHLRHDRELPP